MSMIAAAVPILPGKKEQWERFADELRGQRHADFAAARQRAGVHERTFLQHAPDGTELVLVTLAGEDPASALARMANEDTDFARWFAQQVKEIHGFDPREPLPGPPSVLVVDSGAPGAGSSAPRRATWAQIIKARVKPGKEEDLVGVLREVQEIEPPGSGLLRTSLMRDQKDPSTLYTMVVFESEEKARAREQDPRRQEKLQAAQARMTEALDGPPQFIDLQVEDEVTAAADGSATERNKALFRRLMDECFTQGNLDVIEELVSPDWVNIDPSLPDLRGHEGARQLITMWRAGFSDFQLTIEEAIAEGDKVAARFAFVGTHSGEFAGIPPTGKRVQGTGTGIFRFVDGKDVEHRVNFDALGLMQQVGVIPALEQATP